ncbi:MAG: DUF1573 domain-containing protein [Tissierellaceae bacterium]
MDENLKIYDKNDMYGEFQDQVAKSLIRHKSILDIMTKLDEFNARINRAVAKSVTSCGCISINAQKQDFDGKSYEDLANKVKSHLNGYICENCKDILEEEIGNYLFYLGALCNTLDLDLFEILSQEHERNKTLGVFSLK